MLNIASTMYTLVWESQDFYCMQHVVIYACALLTDTFLLNTKSQKKYYYMYILKK